MTLGQSGASVSYHTSYSCSKGVGVLSLATSNVVLGTHSAVQPEGPWVQRQDLDARVLSYQHTTSLHGSFAHSHRQQTKPEILDVTSMLMREPDPQLSCCRYRKVAVLLLLAGILGDQFPHTYGAGSSTATSTPDTVRIFATSTQAV